MLVKLLRAAAITAVLSFLMQAGAFAPSQPRLTTNQPPVSPSSLFHASR